MENNLLDWALMYAEKGYPVFPVHSVRDGKCSCGNLLCSSVGKHPRTSDGFKSATTDEATIRKWWQTWPDANIGLPTGQVSGLVVVDADGDEGVELVQQRLRPNTITVRTGKGIHYIYKAPACELKSKARFWKEVDLRGDGGYVVAPPSIHSSGKQYEWETDLIGGTPEELPAWFVSEMDGPMRNEDRPTVFMDEPKYPPYFWESIPNEISSGGRNDTLIRLAGKLRHWGWDGDGILSLLEKINEERCKPSLSEHEVKSIAASIEKYPAGNPSMSETEALGLEEFTDLGNAKRLVGKFGRTIRYCNEMKKWLLWNGSKWEEDKVIGIREYATDVVKSIPNEHVKISDKTLREKLFKHATKSESLHSIEAMIELAKSERGVATRLDSFDRNPSHFHVKNGVIDLETGAFLPHDQGLLNSKVADVEYNAEAKCPEWDRFLNKIMGGNQEVIKYLQKAIGYSLTGSTEEQIMFILHGAGQNGKSTFINTILSLFGDYGTQNPTSTLLVKSQSYISNDIARLRGARLVVANEANEGQKLDESLIKQMTGGDRISARFLHQEFFEFQPRYKIFLITNHLPTIHGTDKAIWRRIKKIPFEVTIPDNEIDKHLPEKLLQESSGILNWAIEGCMLWRKEEIDPPFEVAVATAEYRDEMDVIERFINERCDLEKSERVAAGLLHRALKDWLQQNNEGEISSVILARRMKEKGFQKRKGKNQVYYQGIRLKSDEVELDSLPLTLD